MALVSSLILCDCLGYLPDWCKTFSISLIIFLLLFIPYFVILDLCFPLVFRLLLQSTVFWTILFIALYGYTVHVIRKRLQADYPIQTAKVLKAKTIPVTPHPKIPSKTFVWIELLDDDDDDDEAAASSLDGHQLTTKDDDVEVNQQQKIDRNNQSVEEALVEIRASKQELIQDLKDWAHIPCVLVTTDRAWKKDDRLTVSLIDGDPLRAMYVPFMEDSAGRMSSNMSFGVSLRFLSCTYSLDRSS